MPINISTISKNMKDLKLIENKIDLLTQRVNDLNMIFLKYVGFVV